MMGIYFYFSKNSSNKSNTTTSIYQKFNPFGSGSNNVGNNSNANITTTSTGNINNINGQMSRFHKITNFAVSGATFFEDKRPLQTQTDTNENITNSTDKTQQIINKVVSAISSTTPNPDIETVPSLRYTEKATGHIYEMYLDTKVEGIISNSTILGVDEAIFDNNATSVIYRYISPENNSITSFLATLGSTSNFLDDDILEVSLSPDKSKFFSIIKNVNGVVGTIRSFDNLKPKQVFTSAFTEWLPQWVTDNNIYLTTKPSYATEGSVFNLNITNGTLTKIFGGINGLTTLSSNDGNSILYGATIDTGPKLNIFDVKNHKSIDLNQYGLPEKCIWSKDNIDVYCAIPNTILNAEYPDSWYQGTVSFVDWFAKINTITKEYITIANSSNETPVDATNLFLSDKEDQLFFINKRDSTLWSLDL